MDSEKVKDIKKIAMSCVEKNKIHCNVCPKGGENDVVLTCRSLLKDMLTLINDLESEREWLSAKYRNLEINYNDAWEQYREYEVENRQLKDRIAEIEKENATKTDTIADLLNKQEVYEAEKLKHFAERLKEQLFDLGNIVNENDIDETLKEFLGGMKR